ncbi:MAG: hypothetical protein APR63_01390 [Desulfuromonas sp. SDB]|nr:MAG: hypothetical protein APR63_01390 [Desulfuromonas sp. SDB]
MANKRIYQAAKRYGLTSSALVDLLRDLGYQVKSHMSSMSPEMEKAVDKKFEESREDARKEEEKKKQLSEKSKALKNKGKDKKKIKKRKKKVDKEKVDLKLKQTLQKIRKGDRRRKRKIEKEYSPDHPEEAKKILNVSEYISVAELAERIGVTPNEIISVCLSLGLIVTINQRLDLDMITAVADEFGYEVELLPEWGSELLEEPEITEGQEDKQLETRAPVVSVMGHVDHGKTSLLDYIRRTKVAQQEAGLITQHISAYEIQHKEQKITFLDTPGHELFTAMRARGAQLTDICVLVVAADDGVMPQTVEAIDHVRAAGIPMIVAINKMDLLTANPQRLKQQLLEHKVMVEDFGGKIQCVNISAKTGEGIPDLLDAILLEAEMMDLKASYHENAKGAVIESSVEKGRGMIADVLITRGYLKIGDAFIAGSASGKIKAMFNERDEKVESVGPSQPVKVMGFNKLPEVGDTFQVVEEERRAKEIARKRELVDKEQQSRINQYSVENFKKALQTAEVNTLKIILKCDVGGSLEALSDGILRLPQEEVEISIIHKAIGAVTENDVLLAQSSEALILAYNVGIRPDAAKLAHARAVRIESYNIIFEAIESIKKAMSGLLEPELKEIVVGKAEIRQVFSVPKIGVVCGSYVYEGEVRRGLKARVKREREVIHQGKIISLKRFKDDVRKVESNFECGIGIEKFNDAEVGDIIECFEQVEVIREI